MPPSISISDAHDGGNIKLFKCRKNKSDPNVLDVVLQIKPDQYTELEHMSHMQYFSFRATVGGLPSHPSSPPQRVNYIIDNAHAVSYPEAWPGTTVCYSRDLEDVDSWKRNESTSYTNDRLRWEHAHERNETVYFAYFPPYSYGRHLSLVSKCQKFADVQTLGQSLEGREIECVRVGDGDKVCWIIHRQHPGETMAEHYAEGLLRRLLGFDDGGKVDDQVKRILGLYQFYIVPCMCPDGVVNGHLRTNACGANLNREWTSKGEYEAPTMERSPEVFSVLRKMDETGVDLFLDVHGDEELPFNFISGAHHVPRWGKRMESLHGAFVASYARSNSDMQSTIGYPPPNSPEDVLDYMNIATNQVANRFDCLGMVLEMPFKDCRTNPDPERGWTPERSRRLGASVLDPLEYVHPYLRAEGNFWEALPNEDEYVVTRDDYENVDKEVAEDNDGFKPLARFNSSMRYVRTDPVHQGNW